MIIKNADWVEKNIDTLIYALALECPLGNNPTLCPLHDFRHCSMDEQTSAMKQLSQKEKLTFYEHHVFCFKMRRNAV